ncbi:SMI1/KNR4 family protein [Flavobacterium gelatinilyticum]|uniref:SMI1/KNR4 family protein n=1 Tax=Flavobacterium gelatinilyticum TaxID=3003260 RepID=UPI0024810056|nr:SMI1/KNR4 family protein [Flavobacterium gelatinilyticum]
MAFPVDIKYVQETEEELGLKFSPLFKEKMIEENGGEAQTEDYDWNLYPFFDKSDKKRISRTCNHIILETKQAKEWGHFPLNAIAVGGNGCGDQLILLPCENNKILGDTVYFWCHETGEVQKAADNIQKLI